MKIAVLGATGQVGGLVVERLLNDGHNVRALVRTPAKYDAPAGVSVTQGDATDELALTKLFEGVDAVISTIGNPKGQTIMAQSANAILAAARAQSKAPKCLFVSSIGAGGSSWLIQQVLRMFNGKAGFDDYDAADVIISEVSDVPYVLIRPAALTNKDGVGDYNVFTGDGTFARPIARADVAKFLVDALATDQWDGQGGFQLKGVKG